VPGKLPYVGATLTEKGVLLSLIAVAVKFVTLELELESVTVWLVAVLLGGNTKLSEFGLAERGLVAPLALAFSVTGICKLCGVPPAVDTLMKPTSVPNVGAPAPIETLSTSGVVPDDGVTVSQLVSE